MKEQPNHNKTITTKEQPSTTQDAGGEARCDEEELLFNKYNYLTNLLKTYSFLLYSKILASCACAR